MKLNKTISIIFMLIFALILPSCQNIGVNDPGTETAPEASNGENDFSFSITWGPNGSQTYDSKTCYLANDLHSTNLILTEEEMNQIKKLIEDADIDSHASKYEGNLSKPPHTLDLSVTVNGMAKTIFSNLSLQEPGSPSFPEDEKMGEFVTLCYKIITIISNTDEYKNLPRGNLYI